MSQRRPGSVRGWIAKSGKKRWPSASMGSGSRTMVHLGASRPKSRANRSSTRLSESSAERWVGLNRPRDVVAAHPGETGVAREHVWSERANAFNRLETVARDLDRVTIQLEHRAKALRTVDVVLDDEDAAGPRGRARGGTGPWRSVAPRAGAAPRTRSPGPSRRSSPRRSRRGVGRRRRARPPSGSPPPPCARWRRRVEVGRGDDELALLRIEEDVVHQVPATSPSRRELEPGSMTSCR
jgi:hypothetical protein